MSSHSRSLTSSPNFDYNNWGGQELTSSSQAPLRCVPAEFGLVIEDVASGWVGAVVRTEISGGMHVVELEDRHGRIKTFRLGFGFLIDGEPIELVAAQKKTAAAPARTASGSVKVTDRRAREALSSRIWVEGTHDAELVEKVWGDDLRVEGIVVEPLGGVDDLADAVREFAPTSERRLGILVDHLLPGTKEQRIADAALKVPGAAGNVLIVGHPYIDVWQVIKPSVLGIKAWPQIPRGVEWKKGIMSAFGWPHEDQADTARAWKHLLSKVKSYADLEPSLLGRVEEVIDFLTSPVS